MLDLIFGGITGLIGTIWSGYNHRKILELDLKAKALSIQYNIALIKAESEALLIEANANIKITESQSHNSAELVAAQVINENQLSANTSSMSGSFADKLADVEGWVRFITIPILSIISLLFGFADMIKGLARPIITIYLLVVCTWLSYEAWHLLEVINAKRTVDVALTVDIIDQITSVLLYLATTAVTWWFGDRMSEKAEDKIFKGKKAHNIRPEL